MKEREPGGRGQPGASSSSLFERLYRAELDGMTRLAFLLTGSVPGAQDVVHDAFLKVRPRLGELDRPAAYLRTTVVNECRMWWRHNGMDERQPLLDTATVDLPADVDHVWSAIRRLPPRRREAVVLRFYLDLSTEQVAEVLGCRPGTARSLIHRGLVALRKELDPDD